MKLMEIADVRVVVIGPTDPIDKAIALMQEHGIRHLPVVRHGEPVGMLSDRDLMLSVGFLTSHQRTSEVSHGSPWGPTKVYEIMSVPVYALPMDSTVAQGGRLLLNQKIGSVVLTADSRLAAIVTQTDLLKCFFSEVPVAPRSSFRIQLVASAMHAHLFTLSPGDALGTAVKMIRSKRLRHLPIVEGDELVGMVSDRDIRLALGRESVEMGGRAGVATCVTLRDIMTVDVQVAHGSETLSDAAQRMVEHKIGSLPVMEHGKLVGIITETDLLQILVGACEGG